MVVYFVVRHLELTDVLRAYVENHLIDPIRRYDGPVRRVEVQLFPEGEKGNHFACHVLVDMKGGHAINVREIQDSIFAAIDVAKDRVTTALAERRDRLLTLRRHPKKYSLERLGVALGWIQRRMRRVTTES